MSNIRINLYSDTQTRPTPGMRRAMAEAEVGDEQRQEDPSTNRLQEMAAELLGKEAALFLPSGTMCNQIALLLHCRPGDEIIADTTAHIINSESGGGAVFAGAMIRPLHGECGIYTPAEAEAAIRPPGGRHAPVTRLIEVEQTSNFGGGSIWPLATLRALGEVAKTHGLAMHMDGARLLNAVVASGVSAADYAQPCDTVWLDLSKGLGCPVGAVLAGSREAIDEAWTWKHRMGGAMRQSGIIAAAGIYALENHVERLGEDHANARAFAERITGLPGVALKPASVETNIVFFDISGTGISAAELAERLLGHGVRIGAMGPTRMRAVTHLDLDRAAIDTAAGALAEILGSS